MSSTEAPKRSRRARLAKWLITTKKGWILLLLVAAVIYPVYDYNRFAKTEVYINDATPIRQNTANDNNLIYAEDVKTGEVKVFQNEDQIWPWPKFDSSNVQARAAKAKAAGRVPVIIEYSGWRLTWPMTLYWNAYEIYEEKPATAPATVAPSTTVTGMSGGAGDDRLPAGFGS